VKDHIALIEMVPPTKLVTLDKPIMTQISDELSEIESNPDISVVIITGKENCFAAGASIPELATQDLKEHLFNDYFERIWWKIIPKFRKPIIAAVNGICLGGGLELALMCDIVLASDNARLGLPEIKLGIIPGSGGTQRLPAAVGKSKAMEMILTGEPISAADALKWHLVSGVHPQAQLLEEAHKIALKIASMSQIAAGFAKRSVNTAFEIGVTQGTENERNLFMGLLNTNDKNEGIKAFEEKRKAKFTNT
jgi:enoyl-CoA hydratase/carnithine racemase